MLNFSTKNNMYGVLYVKIVLKSFRNCEKKFTNKLNKHCVQNRNGLREKKCIQYFYNVIFC